MLEELEKAEKFIFMEYFIIEEGYMWGAQPTDCTPVIFFLLLLQDLLRLLSSVAPGCHGQGAGRQRTLNDSALLKFDFLKGFRLENGIFGGEQNGKRKKSIQSPLFISEAFSVQQALIENVQQTVSRGCLFFCGNPVSAVKSGRFLFPSPFSRAIIIQKHGSGVDAVQKTL